jgi:hypothetical protein
MPRCEVHGDQDAVGYCHGCGTFGCAACLVAQDASGNAYCRACAERMGLSTPGEPVRPDQVRHLYVVRLKDGRRLRGTFYTLDLDEDGFNFVAMSLRTGHQERVYVPFHNCKAIFQVRDLRGHRRHPPRYLAPNAADPEEAAVYFSDGEVIRGHIRGHWGPHDKRFCLVPGDPTDNNEFVIVETSAVDRVELQGTRQTRELRDLADNAVRKRLLVYYWRHRGRTVTAAEIARRIERVESAVAENLAPYIEHGLIEPATEAGRESYHLKQPADRATREFLKSAYHEISRFYFHGETRPHPEARPL